MKDLLMSCVMKIYSLIFSLYNATFLETITFIYSGAKMLELNYLRQFVKVIECGTLSKAAEELFITQ